jgi:trehalose-phosphatase
MKHFFDDWATIKESLKDKTLVLFLDFDGTLAAIVDHYQSATILRRSKVVLRQLVRDPMCLVVIVSGRALCDVKKRVGLENMVYVGNHGLEVAGAGIPYTSFVKADAKGLFRKIKRGLVRRVGKIQGVLIEDKILTISVHYRRVGPKDLLSFRRVFFESLRPYLKGRKIDVHEGKKVLEIKPAVQCNKGSAVLWLLKYMRKENHCRDLFPIFIGDDVTDETAFAALKKKGLCIRVGCGKASAAQYCLRNINQVARFLEAILNLKGGRAVDMGRCLRQR